MNQNSQRSSNTPNNDLIDLNIEMDGFNVDKEYVRTLQTSIQNLQENSDGTVFNVPKIKD